MSAEVAHGATLLDLLDIEVIDRNLFRGTVVFAAEHPLYGGQVAAQALRAGGLTVDAPRTPHSLHGYFLRKGDSRLPTVFQVFRDRDGRTFSARRVVALQNGAVIFSMSASFQVRQPGGVDQVEQLPETEGPDGLDVVEDFPLISVERRAPTQPPGTRGRWLTRFWARATVALGDDPLLHACALTYLSDISTGIRPAADGSAEPGSSLDHAVWFHDVVDMTTWTLSEYTPHAAGRGRGWYTGSIFTADGRLVASLAQEALYR